MSLAPANLVVALLLLSQTNPDLPRGASESSAGAWGGILWIVLMVVVTVVLLAIALLSLRRTKE